MAEPIKINAATANTRPAEGKAAAQVEVELDTSRRSAPEILEGVLGLARDELARSSRALAFSGFAGGLAMGLTGLSVAIVRASLGQGTAAEFVPWLFYPIGFISVIIGRAQLFTENTLYPVVLVLDEKDHVRNTLRLWTTVFVFNVLGALAFTALVSRTGALRPEFLKQLAILGTEAASQTPGHIFWTGIIGGWLIALVAWMVTASHWTIGQIMVVWLLTFVVGIGRFAHCIATSGEIISSVLTGSVAAGTYLRWLGIATAGNILGGVIIVSLLNWGQVKAGEPV